MKYLLRRENFTTYFFNYGIQSINTKQFLKMGEWLHTLSLYKNCARGIIKNT